MDLVTPRLRLKLMAIYKMSLIDELKDDHQLIKVYDEEKIYQNEFMTCPISFIVNLMIDLISSKENILPVFEIIELRSYEDLSNKINGSSLKDYQKKTFFEQVITRFFIKVGLAKMLYKYGKRYEDFEIVRSMKPLINQFDEDTKELIIKIITWVFEPTKHVHNINFSVKYPDYLQEVFECWLMGNDLKFVGKPFDFEVIKNSGDNTCGSKILSQFLFETEAKYNKFLNLFKIIYQSFKDNTWASNYQMTFISKLLGYGFIYKYEENWIYINMEEEFITAQLVNNNHWELLRPITKTLLTTEFIKSSMVSEKPVGSDTKKLIDLIDNPYADQIKDIIKSADIDMCNYLHLKTFSENAKIVQVNFEYKLPQVTDLTSDNTYSPNYYTKKYKLTSPARLSNPLIKPPRNFADFILKRERSLMGGFRDNYFTELYDFIRLLSYEPIKGFISIDDISQDTEKFRSDINKLKDIEMLGMHETINHLAREFTKMDIRETMDADIIDHTKFFLTGEISTMYLLLSRIKTFLALSNDGRRKSSFVKEFHVDETGLIFTQFNIGSSVVNIFYGEQFVMFNIPPDKKMFFFSRIELDYILTREETLQNIKVIIRSPEYDKYKEFLTFLYDLHDLPGDYDQKVKMMKNLETLCLNRADICSETFCSWQPICELLEDTMSAMNNLIGSSYSFKEILCRYISKDFNNRYTDLFQPLFHTFNTLSGVDLLEISSAHKFFYFSYIDEISGVEKFIKRTQTVRPVNRDNILNLVQSFKREFIAKFITRERSLPNMNISSSKLDVLNRCLLDSNENSIMELDLVFFTDITFNATIQKCQCHDPLEFAKDKSCARTPTRFGPGDTIPELLDILGRDEYTLSDLKLDNFKPVNESAYIKSRQLADSLEIPYITKLSMKEREQKKEGRLFGSATLENKHSLSMINENIKLVLNYIDGEMMTITDEDRKKKLHEVAQLLSTGRYVSVLLDIEGHNQSIQDVNTTDLLSCVGQIIGVPNLDSIAYYFQNLTVYYPKSYENISLITKGQKGGIEGWMNPFWTLLTVLSAKLLKDLSNVPVIKVMVYSDDIQLLIDKEYMKETNVNDFYITLVQHFIRFGFIVKPSQTMITEKRCTILRQHYFEKDRADSSIKRLLSITSMNENSTHNVQLECMSITSSSSSSLESSNHIITPIFLKWFKSVIITYRIFSNFLLSEEKGKTLCFEERCPTYYNFIKPYVRRDISGREREILSSNRNLDLDNYLRPYVEHMIKNNLFEVKATVFLNTDLWMGNSKISLMLMTMYFVKREKYLTILFFYYLTMPKEVGGCGVDLAVNQFISGHSVGLFKRVTYLENILNREHPLEHYWRKLILNAISPDKDYEIKEERLVTSEFPLQRAYTSAPQVFFRQMSIFLQKRCKNNKILLVINSKSDFKELQEKLVNINRKKYYFRIVNFYYENSTVYVYGLLMKKVETSTGLIKRLDINNVLRSKLFKHNNTSIHQLFRSEVMDMKMSYHDKDILIDILNIRRRLYPKVHIVDVIEPLYDKCLFKSLTDKTFCRLEETGKDIYKDGYMVNKEPLYGNDVSFKEIRTQEHLIFDDIQEYLIFNITKNTRWMMYYYTSMTGNEIPINNNLIVSANLSLSTLSNIRYDDMASYVQLPSGGEVYHRLENLRYKTHAYIRILPNQNPVFDLHYNAELLQLNDLENSNFNFDYLKMYLITKKIVQKYVNNTSSLNDYYTFINNGLFKHVPTKICFEVTVPENFYFSKKQNKFNTEKYSKLYSYMTLIRVNESNMVTRSIIPLGYIEESEPVSRAEFKSRLLHKYIQLLNSGDIRIHPSYLDNTYFSDLTSALNRHIELTHIRDKLYNESEVKEMIIQYLREPLVKYGKIPKIYANSFLRSIIGIISRQIKSMISGKYIDELLQNLYKRDSFEDEGLLEFELDSNLMNIIDPNRPLFSNIITLLLALIVLESCPKFDVTLGYPQYNIKDTYTFMKGMVLGKELFSFNYNISQIFNKVATIKMFETEWENNYQEIIIELNQALLVMIETFIEIPLPKVNIDLSEAIGIPVGVGLNDLPNINYTMEFFNNVDDFIEIKNKQFMKKFKQNLYIYNTSAIYYSPTGSDLYVSAVGLLKTLLDLNLIGTNTRLVNYCAGRGDFHLASTKLGLKIDSYSLKDTYSTSYRFSKDIHYVDYNIFEPDTLPGVTRDSVSIIDLSFVTNAKSSLINTLQYLLNNANDVIIRLDMIKYITPEDIEKIIPLVNFCYILSPCNSNYIPPYFYILLTPRNLESVPKHCFSSYSQWSGKKYRELRSLIKSNKTIEYNEKLILNSTTIHILNVKNTQEMLIRICRTVNDMITNENSFELNKMSITLCDIPLPETLIEKKFPRVEIIEFCSITEIDNYKKELSEEFKLPLHGTPNYKSKLERNYDEYMRSNGFVKVLVTGNDVELLSYLKNSHPISKVRKYCYCLLNVYKTGDNLISKNEQVVKLDTKIRYQASSNSYRFVDKHLYKALENLIYAMIYSDHETTLKHLIKSYVVNKDSKGSLSKVILHFRKLYPVYYKIVHEMSSDNIIGIARGALNIKIINERHNARLRYESFELVSMAQKLLTMMKQREEEAVGQKLSTSSEELETEKRTISEAFGFGEQETDRAMDYIESVINKNRGNFDNIDIEPLSDINMFSEILEKNYMNAGMVTDKPKETDIDLASQFSKSEMNELRNIFVYGIYEFLTWDILEKIRFLRDVHTDTVESVYGFVVPRRFLEIESLDELNKIKDEYYQERFDLMNAYGEEEGELVDLF